MTQATWAVEAAVLLAAPNGGKVVGSPGVGPLNELDVDLKRLAYVFGSGGAYNNAKRRQNDGINKRNVSLELIRSLTFDTTGAGSVVGLRGMSAVAGAGSGSRSTSGTVSTDSVGGVDSTGGETAAGVGIAVGGAATSGCWATGMGAATGAVNGEGVVIGRWPGRWLSSSAWSVPFMPGGACFTSAETGTDAGAKGATLAGWFSYF